MKTTGEKIREGRANLGITQTELAEKIGVSRQTLSKYETGESLPDIERCKLLAEVLDVSLDDLVNYDRENSNNLGLGVPPKSARAVYGKRGAADVEQLLTQTRALFAGGDVPEEDKELFFQAVTEAYFANKQRASEKFTRKDYKK